MSPINTLKNSYPFLLSSSNLLIRFLGRINNYTRRLSLSNYKSYLIYIINVT